MCHVLIIEDEALIAEYVGELATDAGASSLAYADTERAAIASACVEKPAVILSDAELAEGTGPHAVRAIIEILGPIPVIYITSTPERCEHGPSVVAILKKPISAAAMRSTFRQAYPLGLK